MKITHKTLFKTVTVEFNNPQEMDYATHIIIERPHVADMLSRILGINLRLVRGLTKEAKKSLK